MHYDYMCYMCVYVCFIMIICVFVVLHMFCYANEMDFVSIFILCIFFL